jgi:hypothetical protein
MKLVAVYGLETYGHEVDSRAAYDADVRAMFPPCAVGIRLLTTDELNKGVRPTHALLVNHAVGFYNCGHLGPSKIVHVAMEPRAFLRFNTKQEAQQLAVINSRAGTSVCGTLHPNLRRSTPGYVLIPTRMIQYVPAVPLPLSERRPVSLPFSNKRMLPGHKYRHDLAHALLTDARSLPVDVWGRGALEFAARSGLLRDPRVKGPFDQLEPYTQYAFTIAIENTMGDEGRYFTEKVYLPVYCRCTPLYAGSPHIDEYFPGATVPLSGNLAQDVELVARACAGQLAPCDTDAAKAYFQQHWNWLEHLDALFSK